MVQHLYSSETEFKKYQVILKSYFKTEILILWYQSLFCSIAIFIFLKWIFRLFQNWLKKVISYFNLKIWNFGPVVQVIILNFIFIKFSKWMSCLFHNWKYMYYMHFTLKIQNFGLVVAIFILR